MNGRYTGWLSDDFGRISDEPMGMVFAVFPEERREWVAGHFGFDNAVDVGGAARVAEVHVQQYLEAVNERRLAVKLYAPHPGIEDDKWNAGWRYITWDDMMGDDGFIHVKELIDRLRDLIWVDDYDPVEWMNYDGNPRLNPVGYFFGWHTDGDAKGTNFAGFENEGDILELAGVGGTDEDGERGYTIVPARYGQEGVYLRRFRDIMPWTWVPQFFCVEHVCELKKVVNVLEYLYPALGFDCTRWYGNLNSTSSRQVYSEALWKLWGVNTWNYTYPVDTGVGYAGVMPSANYHFNLYPPSPVGMDGKVTYQADMWIEYIWDALIGEWEVNVSGNWEYGVSPAKVWNSPFDFNKKDSGSALVEKIATDGSGKLAEWGWEALKARKYIEFDYRTEAEAPPEPF